MPSAGTGFPDEGVILDNCDRLVDFHAWTATKVDPRGWLSNFDSDDRGFALILLSRFTYLADDLVDQLFRAAFQNISNSLHSAWEVFPNAQTRWAKFCDDAIVTIVQGEQPNPSDSGWLFARKARQTLGIHEDQLLEPADALDKLASGFSGPIVFVDDFVGSGEQFIGTWQRLYDLKSGQRSSFQIQANSHPNTHFYYCNAMTTEYGRNRMALDAPSVRLSTANLIPSIHSLAHNNSSQWPAAHRDEGIRFVERIGRQLGYTADDGGEFDWRGFHRLGLGIAFEHSMPDANLPLFFTENQGWKPLVRRT